MRKKLSLILILLFSIIFSFAQTPDWDWVKSGNGKGLDYSNDIVTDKSGNLYVTGDFSSDTLMFDNAQLINSGDSGTCDFFIVKYSSAGNVIWAKSFGSNLYEYISDIAIDSIGNLYITGYSLSSQLIIGSDTLNNSGSYDAFIAKFDSSGTAIWAKGIGGSDQVRGTSICTDGAQNVYVTGFYSSNINIDGINLINKGGYDIFIANYDSNGQVKWKKNFGGNHGDFSSVVTADNLGNTYLYGYYYSDTLAFDADTIYNNGFVDIFISKFDNTGANIWAKNIGSKKYDCAYDFSMDLNNNIYATGIYLADTIVVGSDTLINTSNGTSDFFLAKYNSDGDEIWAKSFGGDSSDISQKIIIDDFYNLYLAGYYNSSTIEFGGFTLNSTSNLFITKCDTAGNILWAKGMGGLIHEGVDGIAVDYMGNIFMAGFFRSPSIIFDNITLDNSIISGITADIYVAKINSETGLNPITAINNKQIHAYPNPTTGFLTIETSQKSILDVLNIQGQKILSQEILQGKSEINISNLAKGMYILKITNNGNTQITRVVKE